MNEPIRVAQILGKMDSGGVESVLMNYYRAIDKTKVQFDFFLDKTSEFPQRAELESLGAKIYLLPPYTDIFKYQKTLKIYLLKNKYKIVHSHLNTMSAFPLFVAWRAKVPVRICHNHSTASWAEPKKTVLKYILRPFNKIFATNYFACSEQAGRWMYGNKDFLNNKVFVMTNAIDTQKFKFDTATRKEIRKEFNIGDNFFVIGHVGRFTFAKNHLFLLDIFNLFYKKNKNCILMLVGEGELENEIRKRVTQLNLEKNIIFTGVRNDANRLYNAMDVFCLPSNYEGFSIVAVEAQSNGLPYICSDAIPKEAIILNNSKRLSFKEPLSTWVTTLQNSKRISDPTLDAYEITTCTPIIEKFYMEKTQEN